MELEEDEAALATRDDARSHTRGKRGGLTPIVQATKTLRDALFREGLQQVVDRTQLERLDGMTVERRREHEHRRASHADHGSHQIEARLGARAAEELNVDEDRFDPHPWGALDRAVEARRDLLYRLACFFDACNGADHLGQARAFEKLDQIVARGPLVFYDERADGSTGRGYVAHGRASTAAGPALARPRASGGSSTMDRVPEEEGSSLIVAPEYRSSRRLRTACSPNAPARTSASGAPGPLSSTVHTTLTSGSCTTVADTMMMPPPRRQRAPCLTAFSTSGCSKSLGRSAPPASFAMFQSNRMASPWRAWRMAA